MRAITSRDIDRVLGRPPVVRQRKPRRAGVNHNSLEAKFLRRWEDAGGKPLTPQHKFHSARKWCLDFVDLPSRVAVEIHGGTYTNSRHTTGTGFNRDREKMNTAAALGWAVFELDSKLIADPNQLRQIRDTIMARTPAWPGMDAR